MDTSPILKNQTLAIQQPLATRRIQCAGPHFQKFLARLRNGLGETLSNASSTEEISEDKFDFEIDVTYLRSLDPKEWKEQDHYRVLGIKNLRFNASEDDIRRAYRKIVLKHHPDKRKAQGEEIKSDDDYFTCITKAYETLGVPLKRRSYDSIDPEFDDTLPTTSEVTKKFYATFQKHFELNARWSDKKNVPLIGTAESTRQEVDNFYNFWYEFESWREYSYLDEEDKDKGQDREERRWIEKQNRAIRIKRKKEEMSRIRQLVDLAYNNDPRIVKFRNDDKERKQAAKRAKMNVAQAARAEEERLVREALAAKKEAEAAEQKRIEQIRLEKEQQKRALKKERKLLRDTAKEANYYSTSDKEKIRNAEGVEKICEMLKYLDLQSFNKSLASGGRDVFISQLKDTEAKLEEERRALFDTAPAPAVAPVAAAVVPVEKNIMWNPDNMQLLIKAVNLFPAGTVQRWEVVANYINLHATNLGNKKFMSRDVLNKAKDLQSSDFAKNSLKEQANEDAFASFQKSKKELKIIDPEDISVNNEATETNKTPAKKIAVVNEAAPAPKKNVVNDAAPAKKTAVVNNGAPVQKINDSAPLIESAPTPAANKKDKKTPKPKQNGVAEHITPTTNNTAQNNTPTSNSTSSSNNYNNNKTNAKNSKNKANNNNSTITDKQPATKEQPKVNGVGPIESTTPTNNAEKNTGKAVAKATWTKDEQALLEQAIKTYPMSTADRWERIAECIPNRTKKECLQRVKELVDRVNAKREAQILNLYEIICEFTRDYDAIKQALQKIEHYDKTCLENMLHAVKGMLLTNWGSQNYSQVLVFTDCGIGFGKTSLKSTIEKIRTKNQQKSSLNHSILSEQSQPCLPFSYLSKLSFVCLGNMDDTYYQNAIGLYQELLDVSGQQGQLFLAPKPTIVAIKKEADAEDQPVEVVECRKTIPEVRSLIEQVCETNFKQFEATLKCGGFGKLETPISIWPSPLPNNKDNDPNKMISRKIEICGFLSLADIGSPMSISRHLIMPRIEHTNKVVKHDPSISVSQCDKLEIDIKNFYSKTEGPNSDDENEPSVLGGADGTRESVCVLLHGALKVENLAALVLLNDDWFGFIYSYADSKRKSNLMLTILPPGHDVVPWLGDLRYIGTIDDLQPGENFQFPVKPEKRSYSQNCVVWIKQAGLQSDIQKVLRHAKKLPEKTQHFYKELNRIRRAALSLGFVELLDGLSGLFDREIGLLPSNASPDCTVQLKHAAMELRKPNNRDIKSLITAFPTKFNQI